MIGILGGTFDPIHFGHLRAALDVLEDLGLEQLRFVPLRLAVHREQPATLPEIRLEMVRAAVARHPGLLADDRELRREGPSYTLHTLQSLRAEFGDRPLCLLIGTDAFKGFLEWHEPGQICELAHLVVMQRPGAPLPRDPALRALVRARLVREAAELRAAPGGRFLVPEPVREIILSRGLYAAG